ncbi:MAG: hypothetical protein M3308_05540 [Actinomycetota bacterium]|nr:hypothetical protein [Actinomycetota bacterium]
MSPRLKRYQAGEHAAAVTYNARRRPAIFTKLFIDDLGGGPTVTNDELSEPFATVTYPGGRRLGWNETGHDGRRWRPYGQQKRAKRALTRTRTLTLTASSKTPCAGWKQSYGTWGHGQRTAAWAS